MAIAADVRKPSYLGLLNAISLAESAAGQYLEAWADVTPGDELRDVLRLVAARERSHGEVFCRRIAELGFNLRRQKDPKSAARLARLANPEFSDLDKIGAESDEEADPFGEIRRRMAEGEFDPMTVNLMNWYIAEEKDSALRLREAYDRVRGAARKRKHGADSHAAADGPGAEAEAIMACMTAGFARLEKSLDKLVKATRQV